MSQSSFLTLGIDIGTSKVAAVIIDGRGGVLAVASQAHGADIPAPAGHAEQAPARILAVTREVVLRLPAEPRARVRAVGVTGQMHGVLALDAGGEPVTPLVTWQDGRGAEGDFVTAVSADTGYPLKSGFGCATLAWWVALGQLPAAAVSSGTIHDYLVMALTGAARPVTDPTDAASWGLFDLRALAWDDAAIARAGIPRSLLPAVVPSGTVAGTTAARAAEFGIPAGIPVTVAVGDNQASLLATLTCPEEELALTLGTGGQVSAVLPAAMDVWALTLPPACEVRPFPGGRYALVGASLCGGAGWAWLAQTLEGWLHDLGIAAPPREDIYVRLNTLGLAALHEVPVHPHFLGERHAPELRGSLTGLTLDNATLGAVARGLARGILTNLRDMLPAQARQRARLVGSGNALRKNPLLQQMAQEVFHMPLALAEGVEEAAVGAALLASRAL